MRAPLERLPLEVLMTYSALPRLLPHLLLLPNLSLLLVALLLIQAQPPNNFRNGFKPSLSNPLVFFLKTPLFK